jgi:hypothetical protein
MLMAVVVGMGRMMGIVKGIKSNLENWIGPSCLTTYYQLVLGDSLVVQLYSVR